MGPKCPVKINTKQIIECCGAILLYSFHKCRNPHKLSDYSRIDREFYGYTQKMINKWNACEYTEVKDTYITRIKQEVETIQKEYKSKKSYLIAFLNDEEIGNGAEEVLLDLGFDIAIPRTKNPTGTAITQYVFHLLPKPKQHKSVIKKKEIPY